MRVAVVLACLSPAFWLGACGGSSRLTCGEGTVEEDGECVVAGTAGESGKGGEGGTTGGSSSTTGGRGGTAGDDATGGSNTATGGNAGAAGEDATGGSGNPTGGTGGSDPIPPGATPDEVEDAAALCELPEAGVLPIATIEELEANLVGRWLHCGGPVVFVRDDDTAGIRFDADRTWRFLVEGSDGALVDGLGFDNTGTWDVLDNGQSQFQVNISISGGGYNPSFFVFATSPAKMRLNWMLGSSDYAGLGER